MKFLVTTLLLSTLFGFPTASVSTAEAVVEIDEPPSTIEEIIGITEPATAINWGYVEMDEPERDTEVIAGEYITLPNIANNAFKTYMDYRTITDTTSKQWQYQQEAYTDTNGLRKIGEYYCVALGSGICNTLGTKFEITLDTGESFKVIMVEQKADCHTDATNKYIARSDGSINIVEFIVQTEIMPSIVATMGDVSYMPGDCFCGNIVSIQEVLD